MTPLHALAGEAGLLIDWEDAARRPQRVSDETLRAVLAALELPADNEAAIADSRRRLAEEQRQACAHFLTGDLGEPVALPGVAAGRARLILESGEGRDVDLAEGDGGAVLAGIDEPGYHRLDTGTGEITVAVAPPRCRGVADFAPGRRLWGTAVQLPSLRSDAAFGDFGALAGFARALAGRGADALAISPVHALFPADPSRFSPYAPSSRQFLNVLFADERAIGEDRAAAADAGGELIAWGRAIPKRMEQLRAVFDRRGEGLAAELDAFAGERGPDLLLHARFDALHAYFHRETGATGWQGWPEEFRDPAGGAVAAFAASHADEVRFYIFLQWLAERSLAGAQRASCEAGMGIGLIADLAVGIDAGGSEGWTRPDELLTGLSIGAPPDLLGPGGQNWGLTTFSPLALRRTGFETFLKTLRAGLRHAGGIRIDHVLGLRRLWAIPEGASARDGCYLSLPQRDLFRLLALESARAEALVIGEDLGTVPPGLRDEMAERGILGMRVLWFERDEQGGFTDPRRWDRSAAAMTGTHDLPTVAGWWRGRDIDWNRRLPGRSGFDSEAEERAARAEERASLWHAFRRSGAAEGGEPAPEDTDPVATAAAAHVGRAACDLAIVPAEDLFGLVEQPNLPGTTDEHPNWRRRLPADAESLLARPAVSDRIERLDEGRRR